MVTRTVIFHLLIPLLCFFAVSCAPDIPTSAAATHIAHALSPTATHTATVTPGVTATVVPGTATTTPTQTASNFPTSTGTPSEPTGCLRPAEDYTRITLKFATLNARTYTMLQHAAALYSGEIDIIAAITQGSYTDTESASFGTHSGGGAVDLSVMRAGTYTILWDEIEPLVYALRLAGFAAWLRAPDALYPGSPIHIHAIAIGDRELSYIAQLQLTSDFGYFAGMDGLPPAQGESPSPDPHGGPVICDWMREMGYFSE